MSHDYPGASFVLAEMSENLVNGAEDFSRELLKSYHAEFPHLAQASLQPEFLNRWQLYVTAACIASAIAAADDADVPFRPETVREALLCEYGEWRERLDSGPRWFVLDAHPRGFSPGRSTVEVEDALTSPGLNPATSGLAAFFSASSLGLWTMARVLGRPVETAELDPAHFLGESIVTGIGQSWSDSLARAVPRRPVPGLHAAVLLGLLGAVPLGFMASSAPGRWPVTSLGVLGCLVWRYGKVHVADHDVVRVCPSCRHGWTRALQGQTQDKQLAVECVWCGESGRAQFPRSGLWRAVWVRRLGVAMVTAAAAAGLWLFTFG